MIELSTIIDQINQQIDGQRLAHLLKYHPDKIQIQGHTLKCFCPVHRELAFRSLIFNLSNNTYKCTMKRCPCFEGGSLVRFWAIHRDMELVEAALDLAEHFELNIDRETLGKLGQNYLEKVHEALAEGQLDAARGAMDQALALDPRNPRVRMLSAEVAEAAGESEKAYQHRLMAHDILFEGERFDEARQLLDTLFKTGQRRSELLERHMQLARIEGDEAVLVDALQDMAQLHGEAGEREQEATLLTEASQLRPEDPGLLERLAEVYRETDERAAATQTLERLVECHRRAGRVDEAVAVLERLAQWCEPPEDVPGVWLRIAGLLEEADRSQQARGYWRRGIEDFLKDGRIDQARLILERLMEGAPEDVDLLEQLARIQAKAGQTDESVATWRRLAGMAREVGQEDRVNHYFEQARALDPNNLGLGRDQAEYKLDRGDLEGGISDLFSQAELCLESGARDEGMAILVRIASLMPSDLDKRLRIGRCLERNGLPQEAYAAYCQLVHDLLQQKHFDAAQAVTEEVRRLDPRSAETLELRIEVHLALGQKTEAIEVCRETARAHVAAGNQGAAVEVLQRAVKIDRSEMPPRVDLARLFESQGKISNAVKLWVEMALFHRAQAQPVAAVEAAREALRLDADDREARVILAEGLEASGAATEALEIWRSLGSELSEQTPENPEGLAMLTHALDLAPRDRKLLGQVARLKYSIEGPEAARPLFERWLTSVEGQSDPAAKIEALEQAVLSYPENVEWRSSLADLLSDARREQEAVEHLETLLEAYHRSKIDAQRGEDILERLVTMCPDRLDLRAERAGLLAEQGRTDEAVEGFEALADHHLHNGDLEAGLDMLREALAVQPDRRSLLARTAELLERAGETEQAVEHYEHLAGLNRRQTDRSSNIPVLEKLLTYRPEQHELRAELGGLYEAEGDIDKAVEQLYRTSQGLAQSDPGDERIAGYCRRVMALAPEFTPVRELLVENCLAREAIEEAKQELDQLGEAALVADQPETAEQHFRRIQQIDPDDLGSNERLGKLYEARGKVEEATAAFQKVLAVYMKLQESARAIGVLQKLKRLRPDDLDLRRRLARMLLSSGNRREAGQEWLELLEQAVGMGDVSAWRETLEEAHADFKADWEWRRAAVQTLSGLKDPQIVCAQWHQLAREALDARQFEMACEAATEGLRLDADRQSLREIRVAANRSMTRYEAAVADLRELAVQCSEASDHNRSEQYVTQALEMDPRSPELMASLAEHQHAGGRDEAARTTTERLIQLYRQAGDMDSAVEVGRRLTHWLPDAEEPSERLAGLLVEAGRIEEALAVWNERVDRDAEAGRSEAAQARLARMLEVAPGDIDILRRLADLTYETGGMLQAMGYYDRLVDALAAEGDPERLEGEYRRILDLEPGHLQVKERLGDFLFDRNRRDEARQIFLEIVDDYCGPREQPGEAARLLGHMRAIGMEDLDVREREAELLEATGQHGEAAAAWQQLALLHQRNDRPEVSAQCLVRRARLQEHSVAAQLEAADAFEQLGEVKKATDLLLKAIEVYDRQEQLEPCVDILQRAIELNPQRFDLLEALAQMLERLGKIDRAADQWLNLGEAFEQAEQPDRAAEVYLHLRVLLPGEPECRSRLARLYESQDRRAEAVRELKELARLAAAAGESGRQVEHLEHALRLQPAEESILRQLVEVWRREDHPEKLYETLIELERICSGDGRLEEALALLEEARRLRPDRPELFERSIELFIKDGRNDQAAQQGIELIQTYLDRDEDSRAMETLRRIAEIEPGNIERRISLARLVHANGRESEAMQEFFLTSSKLFGDDRMEQCLQVCEAGLELDADDVRLRDLLGRVLLQLGRQCEAIEVQLYLAALYDERGEDGKARRIFESILETQPDHQATLEAMVEWALRHQKTACAVDHLMRLAESHYLTGELPEAIASIEQIEQLDPGQLELRARLGELYMEAGQEQKAYATWKRVADEMVEAERSESAIDIYERLVQMRPERAEPLASLAIAYRDCQRREDHQRTALRLGEYYLSNGETEQALRVFGELTACYPDEAEPWQRLTELQERLDDTQGAVESYRRLSEIHRGARRFDQARDSLEAALKLAPEAMDLLEDLGELCLSLGRRPEGLEHLARAAEALKREGHPERAREVAARVLKLDPTNLVVRRLVAEIHEMMDERPAAIEQYIQAARGFADAHDHEPALAVLSHMLTLDPSRADQRELYAKILNREGRTEESVEQYLHLLASLEEGSDPRRAIKYCRQILTERPDHPKAHAHLCEVYERSGKSSQALKECEWLADYYQAKGDRAEAMAYVNRGIEGAPENLPLRRRRVELLVELERSVEAGAELAELAHMAEVRADTKTSEWALRKACDIEPRNLQARQHLADYVERTGDLGEARQIRMELIGMMLEAGRLEEARELSERVVEAVIEDEQVRQDIARMFERAGLPEVAAYHYHHLSARALERKQYDGARRLAEQTLELKPRHVGAREILIQILLDQGERSAAMEEYRRLSRIYEENGQWESALRTLEAMIDLSASDPDPRARLVEIYRRLNREDAMVEQLRRLAEIYVNAGACEQAIQALRELMRSRPDDTRARLRYIDLFSQTGSEEELTEDYLQLARIFTLKGSIHEAAQTYEKMMTIKPDCPVCRDKFVHFLLDQGQIHRAIEETRLLAELYDQAGDAPGAVRSLERVLNYAPEELDLRQQLAGAYLKTNRRGLALETFRSLARQYEQHGTEEKLTEVVEQIVEIDQLNVEFRQRLAGLYLRQERFDEAADQYMQLADQYYERGLYDLAEHEYRRVLEMQSDNLDLWQRVIDSHLQVGSVGEVVPDMLLLAEKLAAKGRLKEAVEKYRLIMEHEPENAEVLRRYIEAYIQIGLEQDLLEDYLKLAELYHQAGRCREASKVYQHVLEINPENSRARRALQGSGQASGKNGMAPAQAAVWGEARTPEGNGGQDDAKSPPGRVAQKIVHNYEQALRLNPHNGPTRVKLAEIYDQAGEPDKANEHWRLACETFLHKSKLDRAIEIAEMLLKRNPDDPAVRDLLTRANVQLESLRTIDGLIEEQ